MTNKELEKLTALLNDKPELLDDVEIEGIDNGDYGDFCDAYIASASYQGEDLPDEVIENLDSLEVSAFVNETIFEDQLWM